MVRYFNIFIFFLATVSVHGQSWKDNLSISGYHKGLYTGNYINRSFVPSNLPVALPIPALHTEEYLYHNRINARYYGEKFTLAVGMRNRVFAGYTVTNFENLANQGIVPYANYSDFLSYTHQNGFLPLNIRWFQNELGAALTVFDRFYLDLDREKWHLRIGRQRINWGINQQFNPNDLFNPYNLFDIDYEERPGVDAIRYERYTGQLSAWEVAFAPDTTWGRTNVAARYRTNYKGYDLQFITGKYRAFGALGTGWYGNLGKAGFSGEATYFFWYEYFPDLTSNFSNLTFVTSLDHAFLEGPFVSVGYLYNHKGEQAPNLFNLMGGNFGQTSPYNPLPFRHTLTATALFTVDELTSAGLTLLTTPRSEVLIAVPTLTYSITQNWDLSAFMQIFLTDNPFENQFQWFSNALFIRLKQSF